MRLQAKVLEGGEPSETVVPLATVLDFKPYYGKPLNEAMRDDDAMDWGPWVVWHALTFRGNESRPFDEWVRAVEWVTVGEALDELDPSGGGTNPTGDASPGSSPDATSPSPTSSDTQTSSKKPSGRKRAAT